MNFPEDDGTDEGGVVRCECGRAVPCRHCPTPIDPAAGRVVSRMDWGAALARAENERDEIAERLSEMLCDLTGGLLSKPGYPVSMMVQAVEDYFERTVVAVAWDEGYEAGHATARAVNAEYPEEPANPYRRAES